MQLSLDKFIIEESTGENSPGIHRACECSTAKANVMGLNKCDECRPFWLSATT